MTAELQLVLMGFVGGSIVGVIVGKFIFDKSHSSSPDQKPKTAPTEKRESEIRLRSASRQLPTEVMNKLKLLFSRNSGIAAIFLFDIQGDSQTYVGFKLQRDNDEHLLMLQNIMMDMRNILDQNAFRFMAFPAETLEDKARKLGALILEKTK